MRNSLAKVMPPTSANLFCSATGKKAEMLAVNRLLNLPWQLSKEQKIG